MQRFEEIDAFRGLAILMMVLANFLAGAEVIPAWYHEAPLGWVIVQAAALIGILTLIAREMEKRGWFLSL
jgi:uncharacterized membrane protein